MENNENVQVPVEKVTRQFSSDQLSKFRATIGRMGTTVPNGNIILENDSYKKGIRINLADILKIPMTETNTWRIYSRIFFANPLYRRLIDYLSGIYYNQYFISPLLLEGKQANEKKLKNDYNTALRTLDEDINVESFTADVLSNLLIEGETYYYLEDYSKRGETYFKVIKLPTDYCKIIGTAGTPSINIMAIDLTFIDKVNASIIGNDILTLEEVLAQYPKDIRKAYLEYKKGTKSKAKRWMVVEPTKGIAFSTKDGKPPFAMLVKELARIGKFEQLRDDYLETNLSQILVQKIGVDKDGNPEIDLELAAEFHKNLKEIASKKQNLDAITTLAEIEAINLGGTGEQSKTYEFIKTFYSQFYDDAGISSELFNATTSGSLDYAEKRDEKYIHDLRLQVETWLNYFLNNICMKKVIKSNNFVFSYLETSYKNREKMIESYLEGATYGYSKIIPQIALGVKQRYIESLLSFENDYLKLSTKLVPLQSSHTMSTESNSDTNGRPTKTQDEKKDTTIAKETSQ